MSFVAGGRTNARCTRCKDITSHVVVVVVDNLPVKVECCACGSMHKYYAPEANKKKSESTTLRVRANQSREQAVESASKAASVKSTTSSSRASSAKAITLKKGEDLEQLWQKKMATSFSEAVKYNMNLEVVAGTVIEHPTFGPGVVVEIVGADKANFLFREGIKTLKCAPK